MDERRRRKIEDLEDEFAAARETLAARGASLLYVSLPAKRYGSVPVYTILNRWNQWSFDPKFCDLKNERRKPIATLRLRDGNPTLAVDVYVISDEQGREKLCELIGRAGMLLPESRLDAPSGTARDNWLVQLWLVSEQSREFRDDATGGFYFGVIEDSCGQSRMMLECLRSEDVHQATHCLKGVSRFDAALVLQGLNADGQRDSERRTAAYDMSRGWGKRRSIFWPRLVGLDPKNGQAHMYDSGELAEVLADVERGLVTKLGGMKKFAARLKKLDHEPLPVPLTTARTAAISTKSKKKSASNRRGKRRTS